MQKTTPLTIAAAIGAAALLAIATPLAASAHNYLVSSTPADGEVLTAMPDEFIITTNDDLLELGGNAGGFAMQLQDADGLFYGDGCVAVAGPSMTSVPSLGAPGDYLLTWQAVSIDGHSIDGQIPFTWAPEEAAEPSEGKTSPPVCGEVAEEEQPEPSPAATAEESAPPATAEEDSGMPTELLWIGGALVAVAAAAAITRLVLSRRTGA